MSESAYWGRFWRRRLTRRRLLAGAAIAGSGAAVAALVGCGGDEPATKATAGPEGDTATRFASLQSTEPHDARRTFTPAAEGSRGGVFRYAGFDPVVLDRYDPHQTQFGPMYANLSAVFSKLYMYASHEEPSWDNILPDLAQDAPEMIGDPPTEYVIHLRRGVKFHDSETARQHFPGLAGRELTADDVVFSFNRQRNPDSPQRPYYYRSSQYETIDTIEKTNDYTIRIKTKGPVAPFYHFLADTNAMIVPREIVDSDKDTVDVATEPRPAQRMTGSGPFLWDTLAWGIEFKVIRNPAWFGWGEPELERPYLDGYAVTGQGIDDSTVEALFREKKIDVTSFIDNPTWLIGLKEEIPELELHMQTASGWIASRLKLNCPPFQDWRVRRALHLAVDRQEVIDIIGSGVYKLAGPIGSAVKLWALPDAELAALPGYRHGPEREEDIREARQLYEAAGSPEIPDVWFADIPAYIPRFATPYAQTIRRNLGATVNAVTHPYQRIAEGYIKDRCDLAPFSWGFGNGWIDLDDWVYPFFKTGAPKNSFRVSDPGLDRMLDAQRAEFDVERRQLLGYQIQRYLLGETNKEAPGALCRLDYVAPGLAFIYWPYVKNATTWPWFGNSYWMANVWLDRQDPSYAGRRS